MKKRIFYIVAILLATTIYSCKKGDFDYEEGHVGSSKITYYATFSMQGEKYNSIVKGQTFTDPGVTAKEGETDLEVKVSGSVNSNVPGLYIITYSAVNQDGFPATTTRYVAVLPEAEQAGVNVSGKYNYAAGGATSTITKLAPGFYLADNVWSALTTIPAYFITTNGTSFTMPAQATAFGTLSGTATLAADGTLVYVVTIPEQGIANSRRTWKKQ